MVSEFKMGFLGKASFGGNQIIAGLERRRFPSGAIAVVDFCATETPEWTPNLVARWNFEKQIAEKNPNL